TGHHHFFGGAIILGDVAFAAIVGPVLLEEGGFEGVDLFLHGGTSVGLAGVPGALLYVDGIVNIAANCY
ncbi:MAG: hypothetical protein ACRD4I_12930, partial [Candidatus Angelobacter sp.]